MLIAISTTTYDTTKQQFLVLLTVSKAYCIKKNVNIFVLCQQMAILKYIYYLIYRQALANQKVTA